MKYRIWIPAMMVIWAAAAWTDLAACGDKFLLPSRGRTFQQVHKPAHPASVLIYVPATASSGTALANAKMRAVLTLVGHRVTVARDAVELAQLLATSRADIVLTDLSEASALARQAGASPTTPVILPVMNKPTRSEVDECRKQYLCQLKNTDKPEQFLATIDVAMKRRRSAS